MSTEAALVARTVRAVHGRRPIAPDPGWEAGLSDELRAEYGPRGLVELYVRFSAGDGPLDRLMRRTIFRALARRVGPGLEIGAAAAFVHAETFEIGAGVFVGAQTMIQGRYDGTCVIGDHVWIGPQAFLDARELVIGDYVGWGPGARILGSEHTGLPADVPIVSTDLEIRPVRIGAWADIGTSAVILPGVEIGQGAVVGAGAVVREDVPAFAVVAGVPARFLHWRPDSERIRAEIAGAQK